MRKLNSQEIEVKVKQITAKGALLLLYKTARVDMQMLDEAFGAGSWQSDYKSINGVLYCGIGVFIEGQWVWKWDCGIESRDNDGQEKKGEASDAFKRAGFKWGIGRELYTAPFIWANVKTKQDAKGFWKLENPFMKFSVDEISYDNDGNINLLKIKNNKGETVFSHGTGRTADNLPPQEPPRIHSDHIARINSCANIPALNDAMEKIKAEMGENFAKFRNNFKTHYNRRKEEILRETDGLGL